MPLARYFFCVGGVLLALLFVSDAYAPKPPVAIRADTDTDMTTEKPTLRIRSDRKWPERVVFDTSLPTIVPRPTAKTVADIPTPTTVSDVSSKARALEAFAELQPSEPKQFKPSEPKKPAPTVQHKRKIAKARVVPPMVLVAQQPRYGFFDGNTW